MNVNQILQEMTWRLGNRSDLIDQNAYLAERRILRTLDESTLHLLPT